MNKIIYVDGLPVGVECIGTNVRLTFGKLTVDQIERVMLHMNNELFEPLKYIDVDNMNIHDLVEITFSDVTISVIHK